jgi:hypothetical protein
MAEYIWIDSEGGVRSKSRVSFLTSAHCFLSTLISRLRVMRTYADLRGPHGRRLIQLSRYLVPGLALGHPINPRFPAHRLHELNQDQLGVNRLGPHLATTSLAGSIVLWLLCPLWSSSRLDPDIDCHRTRRKPASGVGSVAIGWSSTPPLARMRPTPLYHKPLSWQGIA